MEIIGVFDVIVFPLELMTIVQFSTIHLNLAIKCQLEMAEEVELASVGGCCLHTVKGCRNFPADTDGESASNTTDHLLGSTG